MGIYIGVISITTVLSWLYSKIVKSEQKLIFIIMVIIPSIFAGLRGVGTDYFGYADRYRIITADGTLSFKDFSLVYVLMKSIHILGGNYQVFIFLISVATISTAFFLICQYKKDINITIAVLSYMLLYYQMSFNFFRQILSAELFLLAIYFYSKNNKKASFISLLVGYLFHSSVLLFVVIYFLYPFIKEKRRWRFLIYVCLFVIIMSLPMLSNKLMILANKFPHYAYYFLNFEYKPIGLGLLRYLFLVILPVVFMYVFSIFFKRKVPQYLEYYIFLCIIGTILWMSSYVSSSVMYRLGYTTLVAMPIIHGYISKNIKNKYKIYINIYLVVFLVFFWWYDFVYLGSGDTVPYDFFWNAAF
jgi:hypothetical protein